jgi:hypothetical protein
VSRSPIYALFGETLDGVSTVRAFKAEEQLKARIVDLLDENQAAFYLTFVAQCWLAVRLELAGTAIITFACLCVVLQHSARAGDETFAGAAGLSIRCERGERSEHGERSERKRCSPTIGGARCERQQSTPGPASLQLLFCHSGASQASNSKSCCGCCSSAAEAGRIWGCRGETPRTPPAAGEVALVPTRMGWAAGAGRISGCRGETPRTPPTAGEAGCWETDWGGLA